MIPLPERERILLGPGPSMVAPRVMRTMAAPVLSHLDPDLMAMMDELRGRLDAAFKAPAGSFSFAVSGTGTSAMETAVANLVGDGTTAAWSPACRTSGGERWTRRPSAAR